MTAAVLNMRVSEDLKASIDVVSGELGMSKGAFVEALLEPFLNEFMDDFENAGRNVISDFVTARLWTRPQSLHLVRMLRGLRGQASNVVSRESETPGLFEIDALPMKTKRP